MKPIEAESIRGRRVLDIKVFKGLTAELCQVDLKYGDFDLAITAQNPSGNILYGYSGISVSRRVMSALDPRFIELSMLKVDPVYFRMGIGTALLEQSRRFAKGQNKRLALKPDRPGHYRNQDERDYEYPLSTPELIEFYCRHGFRKLKRKEVDLYARVYDDQYVTFALWCAGIDPKSGAITGEKRHSMTREEAASLSGIPFEAKLQFMRDLLIEEYKTDRALESNRRTHREIIKEFLIDEES